MKKYMVWLISVLMAVSMTACSNTQKKDTKDQAQITTAAKETETTTEAAKITATGLQDTAINLVDGKYSEKEGGMNKTVVNEGPKVGRNDPCPCGSGKKYKNCCGK